MTYDLRADFDAAWAMRDKMTAAQRTAYDAARATRGSSGSKYAKVSFVLMAKRALRDAEPKELLAPLAPFEPEVLARKVSRAIGVGAKRLHPSGLRLDTTKDGRSVIAEHLRAIYPDIEREQAPIFLAELSSLWDRDELKVQAKADMKQQGMERAEREAWGKNAVAWAKLKDELIRLHVIERYHKPEACWVEWILDWAEAEADRQRAAGLVPHIDSTWLISQLITHYRGPGMKGSHRITSTVKPALNRYAMAARPGLRGVIALGSKAEEELYAPDAPQPIPVDWFDPERPLVPATVPVTAAQAFAAAMRDLQAVSA